ncbi:GNAT family N-acetyltransferase [Microbacterium halotolerans]|uniref:GNAT family N-acetyltransferase n=1 Tax=Microbacterium halotolerans TaxID=246613 RepID=UPI001968BAB2|nr:hypothetical protein [Microbacterium halotolerans]
MRTDDFSHAPSHSRYDGMVLAPATERRARRRDGRGKQFAIRDGSRRLRMTMFGSFDDARRFARRTQGATLWRAAPHGYANGTYTAVGELATIERFTPTSAERANGRQAPAVHRPGGIAAKPTRAQRRGARSEADDRPGPMEAGALFFGETRYTSPLSWLAFSRRWVRLVARMVRMRGHRGHRVYWTWPFSLGTIAFFDSEDAMLAMSRGPEHRELMVWLTASNRWASAGFIRFYAPVPAQEPDAADLHGASVETVGSRRRFREFVEQPRRSRLEGERALDVPLLRSTLASWWRGSGPHPEPVELLLVRDASGRVIARTTVHTDARFDAKLGTSVLLFGATDLGRDERTGREALAALLPELERRARDAGARELIGPVSLLPNQAGGVVTSGFDRRGFVDSAWNPEWVPRVYEGAGFDRWYEGDTWRVDVAGNGDPAPPSEAELAEAGITIEQARRRDMRTLLPELRELVNASFAQLPYYTQITPDEMAAATDGLAQLLDERLLLLARDDAGRAVAFVVVIPDITEELQRSGGALGPVTLLRLLARRRRLRDAILIIQGTHPGAQGRGIMTLLSRQLQHGLRDGGYRTLRSTYVGRENPASARQFERFGGQPLHGYTFYRRPVGVAGQDDGGGEPRKGTTDGESR